MKRFFNIHPFLFGVYPVVALLGHNVAQAYRLDALRPFLIMMGLTGLLWAVLGLVYRSGTRGALATSFLLFLFLVHENVSTQITGSMLFSYPIGAYFLLPIFGVVALVGLWQIWRGIANPVRVAQVCFAMGAVALSVPVFQIVAFDVEKALYSTGLDFPSARASSLPEGGNFPTFTLLCWTPMPATTF